MSMDRGTMPMSIEMIPEFSCVCDYCHSSSVYAVALDVKVTPVASSCRESLAQHRNFALHLEIMVLNLGQYVLGKRCSFIPNQ